MNKNTLALTTLCAIALLSTACGGGGNTSTPAAPTLNNELRLNWATITTAITYELQRAPAGTTAFQTVQNTSSTQFDSFATTSYVYRVRGCVAATTATDCANPSEWQTSTAIPTSTISNLRYSASNNLLSWNTLPGAETYEIQRAATDTNNYLLIDTTNTARYNPPPADIEYRYQVRACKAGETPECTDYQQQTGMVDISPFARLPITNLRYTTATNSLNWDAVADAVYYQIQRTEVDNNNITLIESTPTTTQYTLPTGFINTTIRYQVRACQGSGITLICTSYQNQQGSIPPSPAPNNLRYTTATNTFSWDDVADATHYEVQRAPSNSTNYTLVESPIAEEYTLPAGFVGTAYRYQVRACQGSGNTAACTAYQQQIGSIPPTPAPANISYASDTLSWDVVTGADSYEIESAATASNAFSTLTNTTDTNYPLQSAIGLGNSYRVRACQGSADTRTCTAYSSQLSFVIGNRSTSSDFNTLAQAGNEEPYDLWSDGTTMWVVDLGDTHIYAYNLSNKEYMNNKNIALTSANTFPAGIWSNGTIIWVSSLAGRKIFAYNLNTGTYESSFDSPLLGFINTPSAATNVSQLWSNGNILWFTDRSANVVFALNSSLNSAIPNENFNADSDTGRRGLWSNGTTMWITDFDDSKIYAYNLATKVREPNKDFNLDAANVGAHGLWSDGTTVWVTDTSAKKIFAYNLLTITVTP